MLDNNLENSFDINGRSKNSNNKAVALYTYKGLNNL